MARVFLSYSRLDAIKAKALAGGMRRLGHDVWWDRHLHGGSRFTSEIEAALKQSDVVVVLWTRESVKSAWVLDEAAEGRDRGRLVPVVLDDSQPPLGFRQFQAIDLKGWSGRGANLALKEIDSAIGKLIEQAPAETEAAAEITEPRWRLTPVVLSALSIALLIVVGTAYWLWASPDRDANEPMRVRLAEFTSLSGEVPATVPNVLREEVLAALGTDAMIIASSGHSSEDGKAAGYALKASIRKAANALRFTVHFTDEKSGNSLWTYSFDRPMADMEVATRQVAVAASQVVRCGLTAQAQHPRPLPHETLSLYFSYCQEFWAETIGNVMNASRGLEIARRIVQATPNFARGWSARARMSGWAARESSAETAAELRNEARDAARRAIGLDPRNSQGYEVLAALEPRNSVAREALHKKSVSVRPGDCGCEHVDFGGFLGGVGRMRDALAEFERAHDMVPLSSSVNASVAESLLALGREADARKLMATMLEVWPVDRQMHEVQVRTAFWTGSYEVALLSLADPRTHFSERERSSFAAALRAMQSGSSAAKASAAKQLQSLAADDNAAHPLLIAALAALGADREALTVAGRAFGTTGSPDQYALFEPPLSNARRLPEFAALAERIGLVRYWRQSKRLPDFCREANAPVLCRSLG